MEIYTLPLGAYQTNCYILRTPGSKSCVVIDPGDEPERLLSFLTQRGFVLQAILLTHGHFDHVGAVKQVAEKTGCKIFLCKEELKMPEHMTAGRLSYTDSYGEGDEFIAADLHFQVLHTPGHTPGSVCLRCGKVIFSGDTLFAGSCGRTDLPCGNWNTLKASLARLRELPGDFRIFPGHGEATTLSREREENPYL